VSPVCIYAYTVTGIDLRNIFFLYHFIQHVVNVIMLYLSVLLGLFFICHVVLNQVGQNLMFDSG